MHPWYNYLFFTWRSTQWRSCWHHISEWCHHKFCPLQIWALICLAVVMCMDDKYMCFCITSVHSQQWQPGACLGCAKWTVQKTLQGTRLPYKLHAGKSCICWPPSLVPRCLPLSSDTASYPETMLHHTHTHKHTHPHTHPHT